MSNNENISNAQADTREDTRGCGALTVSARPVSGELMPAGSSTAPARPAAAAVGRPLKNRMWERFARYAVQYTQQEAYRRAIGKALRATKPSSIREAASALAARPAVAQRIAELRGIAARATAFDVATYAQELREIADADPAALQYRGACRYCYSKTGTDPQWRDFAEYCDGITKALDESKPVPSDAGGYGYDGSLHPSPTCKRCDGEGDHLFVADVTRLSGAARRLFKGFGKHGELLMHDQMQARAQLAKVVGLDRDDAPSIARAAAAGAAAGAALGITVATATTPEERMRAYLRLIEG